MTTSFDRRAQKMCVEVTIRAHEFGKTDLLKVVGDQAISVDLRACQAPYFRIGVDCSPITGWALFECVPVGQYDVVASRIDGERNPIGFPIRSHFVLTKPAANDHTRRIALEFPEPT